MSKSLPLLLEALSNHLTLIQDLLPEARERLSEVSVQKINSTIADLLAAGTAVREETPADVGFPPFVTEMVEDMKSWSRQRTDHDAATLALSERHVAAVERQAVALEAIRDKLEGLTGSGGLLSKFLG